MASRAALTVIFGFLAVLSSLHLLEESTGTTWRSGLATAALAPALLVTLALAPLLTYAHVWALDHANAGGAGAAGAGARFVARLAEATLLAAMVALLSSVAVRLGAAGGEVLRLGDVDDVGWLG
jgi:hypothetical protein